MMNKVKVIKEYTIASLEDEINAFIKDKEVISMAINESDYEYIAIVAYREKEE